MNSQISFEDLSIIQVEQDNNQAIQNQSQVKMDITGEEEQEKPCIKSSNSFQYFSSKNIIEQDNYYEDTLNHNYTEQNQDYPINCTTQDIFQKESNQQQLYLTQTNFVNNDDNNDNNNNQLQENQKQNKNKQMANENKISGILPPQKKEYTIVLDLDNTLIHVHMQSNNKPQVYLRPYLMEFLQEISKIAEIIIFTASMHSYAKSIIDIIDPKREYISYIVSREHLTFSTSNCNNKQTFTKDLSILGRNLNKTLFVDDLEQNFSMQPQNGILIKQWFANRAGASQDIELKNLLVFIQLFISQQIDVNSVQQQQQQQNNDLQNQKQQSQNQFEQQQQQLLI